MKTTPISLLSLTVALGTGCATLPAKDLSRLSYTRIFCTPDNESHFDSMTVELTKVDAAPPAQPFFARGSPASRAAFAAFEPGWGAHDLQVRKHHPAPPHRSSSTSKARCRLRPATVQPANSVRAMSSGLRTWRPARGTSVSSAALRRTRW